MKIVRYFLLPFIFVSCASVHIDAMEQTYAKKTVLFKCNDSKDFIDVPVNILKHSTSLSHRLENCPSDLFYSLAVSEVTLYAIIDCLTIIDAQVDVATSLVNYIVDFAAKRTQEEMGNFYFAGQHFRIQLLRDSFGMYIERLKQRISDQSAQKIDDVMQQAKAVFEQVADKENSAIIIDIDDTALNSKKVLRMISVNEILNAPYLSALPQVYALYKNMIEMKFKIFFLTARAESLGYDVTTHNLIGEGYDVFEKIICVPREKRIQISEQSKGDLQVEIGLLAQWKESERNKIAEKFKIVGTLDDTEENLKGENVGYAVLIPSFF